MLNNTPINELKCALEEVFKLFEDHEYLYGDIDFDALELVEGEFTIDS